MEGGTNLNGEQLHKRALDLRDRCEAAFESYVDCGITYLRFDALTHHGFAKAHDTGTNLPYKEIRQRCEIAFRNSDPIDDEELEDAIDGLCENGSRARVRILALFALQAWHSAGIGAAMKTDFPHVSRLLDEAEKGMARLESKLSQLKVDVQAFEAMTSSDKEDSSTNTSPAALDAFNIRTWCESVTKLATAKCPQARQDAIRDEEILGYKYPDAGLDLSKVRERLGVLCEFKEGDEAMATVVGEVEGRGPP